MAESIVNFPYNNEVSVSIDVIDSENTILVVTNYDSIPPRCQLFDRSWRMIIHRIPKPDKNAG